MATYPARILTREQVVDAATKAVDMVQRSTGVALPLALVLALVDRESYPRYNASSYRREPDGRESWGLLQVLTDTARWLGFKGDPRDLFDPVAGIYWGARYLAYQWKRYNGDVERAVAAYNAGTAKRKADGTWSTTPGYVPYVLGRFKAWLEGGAGVGVGIGALVVLGAFLWFSHKRGGS